MQFPFLSDALWDLLADLAVVTHALICYEEVHTAQAGLILLRALLTPHEVFFFITAVVLLIIFIKMPVLVDDVSLIRRGEDAPFEFNDI